MFGVVLDSEPASDHVVRLLAFVPGLMLHSVPYTPTLMFETGETAARVGNCLKVPGISILYTVIGI